MIHISFIHRGNPNMASWRYRGAIPAREIGATNAEMNGTVTDVAVFTKPFPNDVDFAGKLIEQGKTVIVDFCDDHFATESYYHQLAIMAHGITCPTEEMRKRIEEEGFSATVIADPYEFEQAEPHCNGSNLLWFGHFSNWHSMERILPDLLMPMRVVSNMPFAMPWSIETMYEEFARADIVLMPATRDYKSPNRTVESIRQGCFVVAEPNPSINDIPGIWIGNIHEGIQWAMQNPSLANQRTRLAQEWVNRKHSPRTLGAAWKSLCEKVKSHSISGAGKSAGVAGSTSTRADSVAM